jgi:GMP synthase-like glutamine amidotransferase
MNIRCLTHVPFEDAANIAVWAEQRGHTLTYTHLHRYDQLPAADSFDMVAIMGGLMNIYEHAPYPWLAQEKKFIRRTIDAGKKVIGICLGAQLITDVLGGQVRPNTYKEIGWHPIKLTSRAARSAAFSALPKTMTVFHWHGDTFSIPPGAIHLASSTVCTNQAFQYGEQVLALQFHLEYSKESIEKMLEHCSDELIDSPYIQTAEEIRSGMTNIQQNTEWLYTLLDAFTG